MFGASWVGGFAWWFDGACLGGFDVACLFWFLWAFYFVILITFIVLIGYYFGFTCWVGLFVELYWVWVLGCFRCGCILVYSSLGCIVRSCVCVACLEFGCFR